ncbi:MAG: hypothetical protein ACE5FF_13430, partial [Saprospiraceae bacterium]
MLLDPSLKCEILKCTLYTVVEPDFVFPNIQYEILERVILTPYYSVLTAEAFRVTGNEYDDTGWESVICFEECPAWPCCIFEPLACESPCENPPCTPESPNWPECLGIDPPPPPTTTNECGCPIPNDPKIPAGCVRVEDTQFAPNHPGVRHLRVIVKDGFLQRIKTETDDNGCWRTNKRHGGRVKVKIKFKNDKAKVRAIRKWLNVWQYGVILTHKEVKHDPPYNQWSTLFSQDADDESKKRALWYAATGNNAVFEYCDFAQPDGITLPPETLDILLTKASGGTAAAPMFDEMTANPLIFAGGLLGMEGLAALVGILNPTSVPIQSIMAVLAPYLVIWAPDIVYNHGGQGLETSDDVKDTY